uniref:C-type lectin domain-containing protein n=1 Tax=Panagrellus redivivus TaxID=6233 RepID=A0A7E4VPK7_PANRE
MVSTVVRDKKVKALRYLLRRKQCSLILIVEALLLILLLILGITFIWWRSYLYKKRMFLTEQDDRLVEWKDNVTFAHCPLTLVTKPEGENDFALTYCRNRVGRVAFAYRHWRLDEDNNDKTCLSMSEQVHCHEHMMDDWKIVTDLPSEGPKCPGKKSDWNSNMTLARRYVPMQVDLMEYKDVILHSALLIAECPICVSAGASLNGNHTCEIKLDTKTPGWPWHHEKCSDYSKLFTNQTTLCNAALAKPTTATLPGALTTPTTTKKPVRQKRVVEMEVDENFFDEAF